MVSRYDRGKEKVYHLPINACLAPICSLHGMAVTTVEGIGSTSTSLHPVQAHLANSHGTQCGFCSPGMVMSMYTLLRNNPRPDWTDVEEALTGNLCRCTGYRPILEGFKCFTSSCCPLGDECCMKGDSDVIKDTATSEGPDGMVYDPSQEPIFPPELQLCDQFDEQYLIFRGERVTWYRPTTLEQLLELKRTYPKANLVVGNTARGLGREDSNNVPSVVISPTHVRELNTIIHTDTGLVVGVNTTIARLEQELQASIVAIKPDYKTRGYSAIAKMLQNAGGKQIKNAASIGGNIITGSSMSDLNTMLLAIGCTVTVISKDRGKRGIAITSEFLNTIQETTVESDEILLSVCIPFTRQNEYVNGYKLMDQPGSVKAGMRVAFIDRSDVISDVSLVFGGVAPSLLMASITGKKLIGRRWTDECIPDVQQFIGEDLTPHGDTKSSAYRKTLVVSFFLKFFLVVKMELQGISGISKSEISAVTPSYHEEIKCSTLYDAVPSSQPIHDPVGRPMINVAAEKHVTGESEFCDDIPNVEGELYLALVLSTRTQAKIVKVDPSTALSMPGVEGFVSGSDVPGSNKYGIAEFLDDEIFAVYQVTCRGQIIGAIVADTKAHAKRAADCVNIEYEDIDGEKPIVTIEQAIAASSFYLPDFEVANGDVDLAFKQVDSVVEGEVKVGGQEHFYMETNCCLVIPKDGDEIEAFSSSQHLTGAQLAIASALGVPSHRVVVRAKRLGGGFGGKECQYQALLLATAVAANKMKRPVRCMLDRYVDNLTTGKRSPFLAKYKVGFMKDGKIQAVDLKIYLNAGNTTGLSTFVMANAIRHCTNAYNVANLRVTGVACKTCLPSNTGMRGFGSPQAKFICESYVSNVACHLGISPEKVRGMNLNNAGDKTILNQTLDECTLDRCWKECLVKSDFHSRRTLNVKYNSQNRWRKRGMATIPVMYGIGLDKNMMQAGALVHVYTDGSVLLTHAGVEMGQGLHTKMIQIASRVMKIPTSRIHISESSSDKVPNTIPTAASVTTDLCGMAVLNACKTIMKRLEPYANANPVGSWNDWVTAGFLDRVSLSATGFYKVPGLERECDLVPNGMCPCAYFVYGVACSEVEIDCLTGEHRPLRTDVVMDVGRSLNPAIDIGQIEGAFMQGYGLFVLESLKISSEGMNLSTSYAIPRVCDLPTEFNITLLKESGNPKAVYSSKAIGEPPLFLAASIFFAIKNAIMAARAEIGLPESFRLDSPASAEEIRIACGDQLSKVI